MANKYLWLRVSSDKYEWPEIIANSATELARKAGVTRGTIFSSVSNAKKHNYKSIYKQVRIDEDEE